MIEKRIYKLKEEFFPLIHISLSQYNRRKEDLMEWLKEFYDYELLSGKPIRIQINDVYGEYQPLPRKINTKELTLQKEKDYEDFVKWNLPTEFKPESKCHMARLALDKFGYVKYKHNSDKAVARRFVGPAMEKLGEKNEVYYWVNCTTYKILTKEELQIWKDILEQEHIGEKDAANAFYLAAQGHDITIQKNAYKAAMNIMKEKTGVISVKVAEWRVKNL